MAKIFRQILSIYTDSFSGLSRDVWLLSIIMFINRTGSMVLTFMTLYLTVDLGFSLERAGWVMGAYGVGSLAGAYLGGQLADRYGHYYIQLSSLFGGAFILLQLLFFKNFYALVVLVFLFSLIADMLRPANSVAISEYAKPENRTRSFSLMRFAVNLGFAVGPAMGGLVSGLIGYKWVFLIDAVSCIAAGILLMKYFKHKPKTIPDGESKPIKGLSAYRDTKFLIFIFLVFLYGTTFFQLLFSVPVYWEQEWNLNSIEIGFLLTLNGAFIVIFEMPFIKRMESYQRFMILIATGCGFLLLAFLSLMASQTLFICVAVIIFFSLSEMFAMPFMMNYVASTPSHNRLGQYMGLYSMAYGLAFTISPVGGMNIADNYGFFWLFIIMSILSLILTIGFYALRRRNI